MVITCSADDKLVWEHGRQTASKVFEQLRVRDRLPRDYIKMLAERESCPPGSYLSELAEMMEEQDEWHMIHRNGKVFINFGTVEDRRDGSDRPGFGPPPVDWDRGRVDSARERVDRDRAGVSSPTLMDDRGEGCSYWRWPRTDPRPDQRSPSGGRFGHRAG